MSAVLKVRDVRTTLATRDADVHAVRGVSFDVSAGEALCIVGESGSGKSMLLLTLMGLVPAHLIAAQSGSAVLGDVDLMKLRPRQRRRVLGREIGMIFQDPGTTLNPLMTVGEQIAEAIRNHQRLSGRQITRRVIDLINVVGIARAARRVDDYPHELSGGMRQRIGIAIAIANDPKVVLADEPTTALDVTVQAQVLDALRAAREATGAALVMVTHDLGVVAETADRVLVMYGGKVQESADVTTLFSEPVHPYARALLRCQPRVDVARSVSSIPGSPPRLVGEFAGCPFAPRCGERLEVCEHLEPGLEVVGDAHHVACHARVPRPTDPLADTPAEATS